MMGGAGGPASSHLSMALTSGWMYVRERGKVRLLV
jgi:hypothetical protein